MSRPLVLTVVLASSFALAQEEWAMPPPGGSSVPPPANPTGETRSTDPRGRALPAGLQRNPDLLRSGMQFHGEFFGGTSGLGASVSFGFGSSRVAVLLSPSIVVSTPLIHLGLDLSVRIYLHPRQQGVLSGFLRPGVGAGVTGATTLAAFGNVFVSAGGEYLLTRNLGFSAELGLRLGGVVGSPLALDTIAAFGVMLHQ